MSESTAPAIGQSSQGSSSNAPATTDGHGSTSIADLVVAKIAGIATREVGGVHDVGGGAARVVGAVKERIAGARSTATQGISVEVGEVQAAVDVTLIAEYGVAIHELAEAVRQNIISAVEGMTGLEVTEVNVEVTDVFLPGEDDEAGDTSDALESSSRVK